MDKVNQIRKQLSKYQYVQYTFSDINGTSRGKILPVRNADEFKKGIAISSGSLMFSHRSDVSFPEEIKNNGFPNMAVIPDLDTLHPLPWAGNGKFKIAEFYCETAWMPNLKYQEACPRYVAKQQSQKLKDLGYELFSGFEMEFVLSHQQSEKPIFEGNDYCMNKTFRHVEGFLLELDNLLLESGVEIGEFCTEYGPGMIECAMKPQWGIKCPDASFGFVQGLLETAEQRGFVASFISKHSKSEVGIGSHFSHSLMKKETKTNVFYDPSKDDFLSDIARYWIGGLVKHADALTAICCPTVNCYRRLFQPRVPGKCFWGTDDRNAAFRIKNYGKKDTYIENRIPSGKCNPYLVFAANIAAGIDGIVNKIECPPRNDPSASDLPTSLSSALDALKKDDVMVSALSQTFVDWFVQLKTEMEIKPLRGEHAPKDDEERLRMERKMYK